MDCKKEFDGEVLIGGSFVFGYMKHGLRGALDTGVYIWVSVMDERNIANRTVDCIEGESCVRFMRQKIKVKRKRLSNHEIMLDIGLMYITCSLVTLPPSILCMLSILTKRKAIWGEAVGKGSAHI